MTTSRPEMASRLRCRVDGLGLPVCRRGGAPLATAPSTCSVAVAWALVECHCRWWPQLQLLGAPAGAGSVVEVRAEAVRRERGERGFSVLGGASCSTPVTWSMCETRSAFLVRVAGEVPRAKAIAKSSSRSFASSTERSS